MITPHPKKYCWFAICWILKDFQSVIYAINICLILDFVVELPNTLGMCNKHGKIDPVLHGEIWDSKKYLGSRTNDACTDM